MSSKAAAHFFPISIIDLWVWATAYQWRGPLLYSWLAMIFAHVIGVIVIIPYVVFVCVRQRISWIQSALSWSSTRTSGTTTQSGCQMRRAPESYRCVGHAVPVHNIKIIITRLLPPIQSSNVCRESLQGAFARLGHRIIRKSLMEYFRPTNPTEQIDWPSLKKILNRISMNSY